MVVFEGADVTLSGSAMNPQNLALQYQWRQVTGPAVSIVSADSQTATFTAPYIAIADFSESIAFQLTVTASDGAFGFDSVQFEIQRAVAFTGCSLSTSQYDLSAAENRSCTGGSAVSAGIATGATLNWQTEIESNDAIERATAIAFPSGLASKRIGAVVTGTVGREDPDELFDRDRSDFFVLTAPVAGTYAFELCRGVALCARAAGAPDWHLTLYDADGYALAHGSFDAQYGHSFTAFLDAGLPYYVSVGAVDVATAAGNYRLSIVAD
jgi:hypothetical protein